LVQQFKYIRGIDVEPWKSSVKQEVFPGPKVKTDDEIRGILATGEVDHRVKPFPDFIKDTVGTVWRAQI
jgi:hypothetical protein